MSLGAYPDTFFHLLPYLSPLSFAVMPLNGVGQTFTVLERSGGGWALGKFSNTLKFKVKEIDPSSGEAEEEGYEDEYQLEDLEVSDNMT